MTQTSCASTAAGMIATAAFFAPLISTSPWRVFPPLITYFSKVFSPYHILFLTLSGAFLSSICFAGLPWFPLHCVFPLPFAYRNISFFQKIRLNTSISIAASTSTNQKCG